MIKKYRFFLYFSLFLLLISVLLLTNLSFYKRAGAFGCFDQCFNFVAAKFMLNGKKLYSEIFFNHQPLMAYLSFAVQTLFRPKSLYHLILFHRLFVIVFSLLSDFFLIYRFRWTGLSFVLFYESTKYYLFGNAFLPEAIAIYPLVFLYGLAWEKIKSTPIPTWNYFLAGLATCLIVFLTLPYAPVSLLLFGILFFVSSKTKRAKLLLLLSFLLPTLIILGSLPLKDYFFDLFVVNQRMAIDEARGTGMLGLGALKAVFYPLSILFQGEGGFFKTILVLLDVVFLTSTGLLAFKFKKSKLILFVFLILACALNRFVPPGKVFYEAFHLLPWYSLFLFSLFLLIKELITLYSPKNKKLPRLLVSFLILTFIYLVNSPSLFIWEKVDPQTEFSTNYTHYYTLGQTIKQLSSPKDTLFLDLWDDLLYWEAGLDSSYPYSLYTPIATTFPRFFEARLKMFRENPPDFYYSFCDKEILRSGLFPPEIKDDYVKIFSNEKPTCFYIKKDKLLTISSKQWKTVKNLGFHLPSNNPDNKIPKIEIITP